MISAPESIGHRPVPVIDRLVRWARANRRLHWFLAHKGAYNYKAKRNADVYFLATKAGWTTNQLARHFKIATSSVCSVLNTIRAIEHRAKSKPL